MTIRYQPVSYSKFNKIMNTPEMVEVMRQKAELAKPIAESISPERTGEYKASFTVEARANGGVHGDRAEGLLVNTSAHAVNVEWQDNYHVLARTAEQLGG